MFSSKKRLNLFIINFDIKVKDVLSFIYKCIIQSIKRQTYLRKAA